MNSKQFKGVFRRRGTRSAVVGAIATALVSYSCLLSASASELQLNARVAPGIVGTGSELNSAGIVGTGTPGIVGTGSELNSAGIVGTGRPGIVGTGSELNSTGIVGTGRPGIVGTGNPFKAWAETAVSDGTALIAYGPIDDVTKNSFALFGYQVKFPGALSSFEPGMVVAMFGTLYPHGGYVERVLQIDEAFVEGSTPVFLAGHVQGHQRTDGSFVVSGFDIQVGEAGADPASFELRSAQFVEVSGVKFESIVTASSITIGSH